MPYTEVKKPFSEEEIAEIMKQYKDLDLSWYQSTRGPQIAATLIGFTGLVGTMIKVLFNIQIGTDLLNLIITAALILVFGVWTLWGYYKGRKHLLGQIALGRMREEQLGRAIGYAGHPQQAPTAQEFERMSRQEPGVG